MRGQTRIGIMIALLMLTVPIATAEWGSRGETEPNTARDRADGWMEADPVQVAGVKKIYFNGFQGQFVGYSAGTSTGFNPNLGALGSNFETYPFQTFALLGVWTDCNADGYIGFGDNALFEYRSEVLLDSSICPISGDSPRKSSYLPQHNDGTWVREFLPIGWDDQRTSINDNPYRYNDSKSRVWADYGLPEDVSRSTCVVSPMPRGSLHSTGGFLRYADCFTAYKTVETINTVDAAAGGLGLSFADRDHDRNYGKSGSALNVQNPYGYEDDASYVTAFDCSATPESIAVFDPTGGDLHSVPNPYTGEDEELTNESDGTFLRVNVYPVSGPSVNEGGSPIGTINETEEALTGDCDRTNDGTNGNRAYTLFGLGEGDADGVPASLRTQTDQTLRYVDRTRGSAPVTAALVGHGTPYDVLGPTQNDATRTDWFWSGTSVTGVSRNPYVSRSTLGPEPVSILTYYAYVDPSFISIKGLDGPTAVGTYGSDHCIGTAPRTGAWECDPTKWYLGPDGGDVSSTDGAISGEEFSVRVGAYYNFRDIDCHDSSIDALRDQGIHYGVLTDTSC